MMVGLRLACTVALVVASTYGCDSDEASPPPDASERRFLTTAATGVELLPRDVVEITLLDGTIRAIISCNELSASYQVVDGALQLGEITTTDVACAPLPSTQDGWLHGLLTSTPTFAVLGTALDIESSVGALHMIDATAPNSDDLPLTGIEWAVVLLVDSTGGGALDTLEPAIIRFDGGQVDLQVSCRATALDVRIDAASKSVSFAEASPAADSVVNAPFAHGLLRSPPAGPTTTICDQTTRSDWELQILAALRGDMSYEIDIDELHLRSRDGSGLDLRAV